VLVPDPEADAPGGYPLSMLTYAMVSPLTLDQAARDEYAAFIDYAMGPGQVPGVEPGQLPRGYAPLPSELRAAATDAANRIRELQPPAVAPADPPPAAPLPPGTPSSGAQGPPATSSSRPSSSLATTNASDTGTEAALAPAALDGATEPEGSEPAGILTPILALARNRFFVPILLGVVVLSGLAALEITKRPRRARSGVPAVPKEGS
jgi:hypothetical protein